MDVNEASYITFLDRTLVYMRGPDVASDAVSLSVVSLQIIHPSTTHSRTD